LGIPYAPFRKTRFERRAIERAEPKKEGRACGGAERGVGMEKSVAGGFWREVEVEEEEEAAEEEEDMEGVGWERAEWYSEEGTTGASGGWEEDEKASPPLLPSSCESERGL
jgi:hypothetical protein